jgi:hypothetical protein
MARAAGIVKSHAFDNLDAFVAALPGILRETGPIFVNLHVVSDETVPPPPPRRPAPERARQLMQVLAHSA